MAASGSSSHQSINRDLDNDDASEHTPLIMTVDTSKARGAHEEVLRDPEAMKSPGIEHGDRAAQLLGDQHVELTEEDVRVPSLHVSLYDLTSPTEYSHPK
jgi:hypothetical protein